MLSRRFCSAWRNQTLEIIHNTEQDDEAQSMAFYISITCSFYKDRIHNIFFFISVNSLLGKIFSQKWEVVDEKMTTAHLSMSLPPLVLEAVAASWAASRASIAIAILVVCVVCGGRQGVQGPGRTAPREWVPRLTLFCGQQCSITVLDVQFLKIQNNI